MTAFGQYADDDGASAVKARDHKDATDLVVMGVDAGSGADLSPSLTGEGHDGSEDGRGRKAFAVASVPPTLQKESYSPTKTSTGQALDWCVVAAFDERNITSAANRTRVEPGLPANTLHAEGLSVVSFTQNTRDEVRLIGGDGDIAGALGAEEGMHQRNYITTGAVRRLTPTECTRLQGFPDDWQEITDADETQAHAREVLHGMWREAGKEHREGRRLGIAFALLTPEILLAGVYGGWVSWEMAYESAGASREIQGTDAWPEGFMQALRQAWQAGSSPYRRESFEQFARQLGRPVQELPLEGAQARAYLLSSRVWAQASQEWTLRHAQPAPEEGNTPRLSDSARYRQLGNAVAVPVARWIAARIAEVAR